MDDVTRMTALIAITIGKSLSINQKRRNIGEGVVGAHPYLLNLQSQGQGPVLGIVVEGTEVVVVVTTTLAEARMDTGSSYP